MEGIDRCPDWPPPDGEQIGEDRARVYVAWIRRHAPPLVAEATRMLRERHGPEIVVTTHAATVRQLASWSRSPTTPGLSIGSVAAHIHAGDLAMVNLTILRDGRLVLVPGKNMQ